MIDFNSNGFFARLKQVNNDTFGKIINDFLESRNYKAPYWRITQHGNNIHIDVGSWSEFFRIELEDGEKYEFGKFEGTN